MNHSVPRKGFKMIGKRKRQLHPHMYYIMRCLEVLAAFKHGLLHISSSNSYQRHFVHSNPKESQIISSSTKDRESARYVEVPTELQFAEENTKPDIETTEVHEGTAIELKETEEVTKGQTQHETLEDRASVRLIGVVHTSEEETDETKYKGENEGLQGTGNLEENYKNTHLSVEDDRSCKPEINECKEEILVIKAETDDNDKKNYVNDDADDEKIISSEAVEKEREDDFAAIKLHALQAPQAVRKSVQTLVEYLLISTTSQRGMAWAIFVWIADNIQLILDHLLQKYNTESFFSGQFNSVDAESVLKSGLSVCSGYANLFEDMCRMAGLSVKVISGFSKGYGYSPERPFTPTAKTDHAWNAVLIDNSWRFVECTWGAGHLDQSGKFQKDFNDFYFLTDPKHFISAHFPCKSGDLEYSNTWQLLDQPINLDGFSKTVELDKNAMVWGISPSSHTEGVVVAQEEVEIVIEDKMERLCGTSVKFYNCETGKSFDEYTFLRKENPTSIAISLRPPSEGKFQLKIYGTIDQSQLSHSHLMSYVIKFSNITTIHNPYPFNYGQMWGMCLEAFENGFKAAERYNIPTKLRSENGYIDLNWSTTRNVPTIAQIEPATKQLPGDGERYCLVSSTENELNVLACFPDRDLYKLEIMCQRVDGDERYHQMAFFLIDCRKPADPCLLYPATYSSTQEYRCKLIEPLVGQLPANSSVTCRFQSPLVLKAMVAQTKMNQDGEEWSATVTTPDVGEKFHISGNVVDENMYYSLFKYDIV